MLTATPSQPDQLTVPSSAAAAREVNKESKGVSPAVSNWRRAVKAVTPDLVRKARALSRRTMEIDKDKDKEEKNSKDNSSKLGGVLKKTMKASTSAVAASARLASSATAATRARATETSKTARPKDGAERSAFSLRVTKPEPFRFATDSRSKGQAQGHQPMKVTGGQVDLGKMLKSYGGSEAGSGQQERGRSRFKVSAGKFADSSSTSVL